mgnify:FL=1
MSFGQSRVLFVMSRDGLLPKFFGHVHPKYKTPARSSMLVCVVTAITAGFLPINIVAEMTNIGTLCAFIIVSAAVIVLRKKNPNQERAFKCPLVPLVPLLLSPSAVSSSTCCPWLHRSASSYGFC